MDPALPSFLSLPAEIRKRIYVFAHLTRDCPISIVPVGRERERVGGPQTRGITGWGWYCQFQHRLRCKEPVLPSQRPLPPLPPRLPPFTGRLHDEQVPFINKKAAVPGQYECRECVCPKLPKQLLLVNKFVHQEVQSILYGENKFVLRAHNQANNLEAFRMLSDDAVGSIRYLTVRLNHWPCHRGHHAANIKRNVCLVCKDPVSSSDPELTSDNSSSDTILEEWTAVCGRLSCLATPGQLSLDFICDLGDLLVAERVLTPMYPLPRLKECTMRLGRRPDVGGRSLARSTALKLTTGNEEMQASTSQFRFSSLPKEIRLRILEYSNLGPKGPFSPKWKNIYIKKGIYDHQRRWPYSLIPKRECCLSCSVTKMDCCCPLSYASHSPSCQCRVLPLDLFLVSRQMYLDAAEILYSTNTFIFRGPFLQILRILQSYQPDTLKFFRRIKFDFNTTQTTRWDQHRADWTSLVAFIGERFETSKLLIKINTSDDWEECMWDDYSEDMRRRLYSAYVGAVRTLKSGIPNLRGFHITLGMFYSLEPVIEKYVVGQDYDSKQGSRDAKAAHSLESHPRCSEEVRDIPYWHEDL